MTIFKLPPRPSLESLRKQAKKLARDVATGDAAALARARVHLPNLDPPLTQRHAQLVIARDYGFAGWQELAAEVRKRAGQGLDWAITEAQRVIHDNDVAGLQRLLAEYPALLSWRADDEDGGLLGMATGAYGDAGDPQREQWFTRGACAEALIDAGAVVTPSVCDGILESRARGLLELFQRKRLLPRTLAFVAALGDKHALRTVLEEQRHDSAAVAGAFVRACAFGHEAVASMLLERLIELDPALGRHVDATLSRGAFVRYFIDHRPEHAAAVGLWKAYVMAEVTRALHERDLPAFVAGLLRERWLLDEAFVWFQAGLIEVATLNDRSEHITALLDLKPAIVRCRPPPPSQAVEFAFVYANIHLLPLLTRIWPVPDDLPHAAGTGDLDRVRQWFDAAGALRDVGRHYPYNDARARSHLKWDTPTAQQVLDVALAFAVTNHYFETADFLLERGADINTRWSSHEPASLLHHLVGFKDYDGMRYLIDRGIDMTIKDYRWSGTAQGWAFYAMNDSTMADWLGEAERQQQRQR